MAERRMFTQKIIDSDAFLDMPLSTQALYFHLNMRADDDGFVNSPKRIQRTIGATEDDLKLLFAKRFVIGFESGVLVIKHWRMHNTLRKDRYNPTQYQEEYALLDVKDNNAYTEKLPEIPVIPELPIPNIESLATTWQPSGNHSATQYSIGKDSIGKESIEEYTDSDESEITPPEKQKRTKPSKHKHGEFKNVLLTADEFEKLADDFGSDLRDRAIAFLDAYIEEKGYKSRSHNLAIRRWVIDAVKDRKTKTSNSTFDTGEFFEAAIARSWEESKKTPPKTAGNDPIVRGKAEALKERLG